MTPAEQEAYRAERARVDAFYSRGQAQRSAKSQPQQTDVKKLPKQKKYPPMVSLLGQGFRNLYDALGGND
jgi:hypothetical protein